MFRRHASFDGEAAAAARRRLAALTAHLAPPGSAETDEVDDSPRLTPPNRPPSAAGRHLARDRATEIGRWDVSTQHVTVVALVVAAVVVVAAWWVLRAIPHSATVRLANDRQLPTTSAAVSPGPVAAALTTAPVGASTSGSGGQLLVVDVTGKVRRPGIVELSPGARVVDAIKAAGGARPGVDIATLNLARLLVDGEQIVVGIQVPAMGGPAPPASAATATGEAIPPVNLNSATEAELETLPGIGPVTAQSILDWRTQNGSFSTVDELLEVSGIGAVTLADIEPYVYV